MRLFDVYPRLSLAPDSAQGVFLWSRNKKYLDFYGGHCGVSIGHCHPHYIQRIETQLRRISFYTNALEIPIQEEVVQKLGKISGCDEYQLFLCNSGAEANENALKVASFHTGRKKMVSMQGAFHGRTCGALAVSDSPKIKPLFQQTDHVEFIPLNDIEALQKAVTEEVAAVILEGIQGIGGIQEPTLEFLQALFKVCEEKGALVIFDEAQSGYGRTGKFFSFQHFPSLKPHIITVAKGMGNGFPVAGVLIHPVIHPWIGMLGTTFGGNHLACAASLAVLEVMEKEKLIENAHIQGEYLKEKLLQMPYLKVKGKGLMIGIETARPAVFLREALFKQYNIITGISPEKNTIRLLPPLVVTQKEADLFLNSFADCYGER